MPVILLVEYEDGGFEEIRIPAEIWRYDPVSVKKLLLTDKEIVRVTLDPHRETADADESNNVFPPRPQERRFELHKDEKELNPMQEAGTES